MRIIAIDPGHTTGVVIEENNQIVFTGSFSAEWFVCAFGGLLESCCEDDRAVIERMPTNSRDTITQAVYYFAVGALTTKGIPYTLVAPGEWKPVTPKQTNPFGVHINDALGLLYFVTVAFPDRLQENKTE